MTMYLIRSERRRQMGATGGRTSIHRCFPLGVRMDGPSRLCKLRAMRYICPLATTIGGRKLLENVKVRIILVWVKFNFSLQLSSFLWLEMCFQEVWSLDLSLTLSIYRITFLMYPMAINLYCLGSKHAFYLPIRFPKINHDIFFLSRQ